MVRWMKFRTQLSPMPTYGHSIHFCNIYDPCDPWPPSTGASSFVMICLSMKFSTEHDGPLPRKLYVKKSMLFACCFASQFVQITTSKYWGFVIFSMCVFFLPWPATSLKISVSFCAYNLHGFSFVMKVSLMWMNFVPCLCALAYIGRRLKASL